jgi:hypothetical protein
MSVPVENIHKALLMLMKDTFEEVRGLYLDKGTSLFETLDEVSAEEASKPISEKGTSIAAHVEHTRFHLNEIVKMDQSGPREVNWDESWKVSSVSEDEWRKLKADLKSVYEQVCQIMQNFTAEAAGQYLPGAISVIAHSAYHLGAIRQILLVVK